MAEYSYAQRNPAAVLRKEGVEDEREKAARILALCADKPIHRIRSSADIQRPKKWTLVRDELPNRHKDALAKRDEIYALLKARGPMLKAHIEQELGYTLPCDAANLHSLTRMRQDGKLKHVRTVVVPGKKGRVQWFWEAI